MTGAGQCGGPRRGGRPLRVPVVVCRWHSPLGTAPVHSVRVWMQGAVVSVPRESFVFDLTRFLGLWRTPGLSTICCHPPSGPGARVQKPVRTKLTSADVLPDVRRVDNRDLQS